MEIKMILPDTNPAAPHPTRLMISPGAPLHGELGSRGQAIPGDKSLSHRAALLAAMADGSSCVENFLVSGVTRAMLNALTALDVKWELKERTLYVEGIGLGDSSRLHGGGHAGVSIDCGNSATTMRLLAGGLAALGRAAVLDGSPGLRRRPMTRIIEPLQSMGVMIQAEGGCAPLSLLPSQFPLRSIEYTLPVASAQVKSCLLLAGLAADGDTILSEPAPSRDHTERMLRLMGVQVTSDQVILGNPKESFTSEGRDDPLMKGYLTRLSPPPGGRLLPLRTALPGDFSAAAFLIVGALITPGSRLVLRGVGLNPGRTGLLDALHNMGASISISNLVEVGEEPVGDITVEHSPLNGTKVDSEMVVRMIDEFPAFAVAAAFAEGETLVKDAGELRFKESDRIAMLCQELRRLGAGINETADGFTMWGGRPLKGGTVNPHGDHRLAMSLALVGLASAPVVIEEAGIMGESFPDFATVLTVLGANVEH
jgi:3-phosphoshikimate 1-carboxyvinyltransferase